MTSLSRFLLCLLAANVMVIGLFISTVKYGLIPTRILCNSSVAAEVAQLNSGCTLRLGGSKPNETTMPTTDADADAAATGSNGHGHGHATSESSAAAEAEAVTTNTTKKLLQIEPCRRLGYSQDNQDCILEKIFNAIGTTNKFYVEYGFNTNEQCSFSGPNTCHLWKKNDSWTGLLLDGSHSNPAINLHAHYLYSNNMVAILDKYQVPKELDFYSGDMDSHDYFIMKTVLDSGKYRPRVVSTEYNANYPLPWAVSQMDPTISNPNEEPPPYKFQNCTWGASPTAFRYLMQDKYGYKLVAVTKTLDLFWVRGDILDEWNLSVPSYESLMAGKAVYLVHPPKSNPFFLSKLVDVKVYEETKNFRLANRAIVQTILEHIQSKTETTIPCLAHVPAHQIEAYLAEQPPIGQHLNID